MNIYCPNQDCQPKNPLVMEQVSHMYSWFQGRPTKLVVEFKCPECGYRLRFAMPVTGWK